MFEKFSRAMILAHFDTLDLHYLTDRDGDVHLRVPGLPGGDLMVMVAAEGADGDILAVSSMPTQGVPEEQAAALVVFADSWNRTRRWPKAHTSSRDGQVRLIGEHHVLLPGPVTQEFVDELINVAVSASITLHERFAEWLAEYGQAA